MSLKPYPDRTEQEQQTLRVLGYIDMFAGREYLGEAYKYAMDIAGACRDSAHATTAVQVLHNTWCLHYIDAMGTKEKE